MPKQPLIQTQTWPILTQERDVIRFIDSQRVTPLAWKTPRHIRFTADCFHGGVQADWLDQILSIMALCPRHTFEIVTQHPEQAYTYLRQFTVTDPRVLWRDHLANVAAIHFGQDAECAVANTIEGCLADGYNLGWPLANLWLGIPCEDQETVNARLPWLIRTPAALRLISCTGATGPLDLATWLWSAMDAQGKCAITYCLLDATGVQRHATWMQGIVRQCAAAGVACVRSIEGDRTAQ